ncbi:MAG: substrate-binding domain-containing protein [Nitrospiraceae bacterium]|nr:substrate-binding domain-containing protein [Nitrospiraceae bacterium]
MKKFFLAMCFAAAALTLICGPVPADEPSPKKIMLASTIGPIDAGIVGALESAFTKKTGIVVEHTGAGTGQALKLAETGNYDLVLVHAKALEEKFVAAGFGTKRYDLMYNDFVILGPAADPAKIRGMKDAAAALRRIAETQAAFITRGDKSGTHVKELEVWKKAGIDPKGAWYAVFPEGAKGNAATLAYTNDKQAYTIMDRATCITLKAKISLQTLVERDDILLNYITLIPVNPAKFPQVRHAEAMQFVDWLQGREAQTIIRDFGKDQYDEPLFFPNAPEGKKL